MASLASILTFNIVGNDAGASRAIAKVGAAAEAAGTKSAAAARKSESAWTSGAVAFQKAGKVAAVATVAFAAYGVDAASKFQKLTTVYVTAAGESQKNLKLVQQGVLGIATATGTAWQDVAAATYIAEKANLHGADALVVVKAAAQGAKEENANLTTVVQGVTSVMASYHLKASDAVSITNQLKTASGEAKTTFEDYVGSLSTVLPIASAAHIGLADVLGVVSQLTQHGTTAAEATQEVANAIRNLNGGNAVASKEMAQFGISSTDVSQKLGTRGLSGTINYLSESVLKRLGPAGTVLLSTFNASKQAAADAQIEFTNLPPAAQKLADAYRTGGVSLKDYRTGLKALPADQAALVAQFVATENGAKGFQQAIKNGGPVAQTYAQVLEKMLGGVNGLNVALQTSGQSTGETAEKIKRISDASKNAGKDVTGWQKTLGLTSTQLDIMKQRAEAVAINVGGHLLPILSGVLGVLQKHPAILEAVTTGVVALGAAWIATKIAGIISNVVGLGRALFTLAGRYLAAGTAATTAGTEMAAANAEAALPEGMVGAGLPSRAAAGGAAEGAAARAGILSRIGTKFPILKLIVPVAITYAVVDAVGAKKSFEDLLHGNFQKVAADAPKWSRPLSAAVGTVFKKLGVGDAFTGELTGTWIKSSTKLGSAIDASGNVWLSHTALVVGKFQTTLKNATTILDSDTNSLKGNTAGAVSNRKGLQDLTFQAVVAAQAYAKTTGQTGDFTKALGLSIPAILDQAQATGLNRDQVAQYLNKLLAIPGFKVTSIGLDGTAAAQLAIDNYLTALSQIPSQVQTSVVQYIQQIPQGATLAGPAQGYSPHALGGVAQKGWSLVGENGPELIHLNSPSRVLSNRESRGAGGGDVHVHVSAVDAASFESWLARGGARKIQEAVKRQGGFGGNSL